MKRLLPLLLALLAACVGSGAAGAGDTVLRDVGLLETARLERLAITPIRVIEDSRCAIGVVCIQAGTVRIGARLETGSVEREIILALGVPVDLGDGGASLARVCPYPVHGTPIRARDYVFSLLLAKAGVPPPVEPEDCSRS